MGLYLQPEEIDRLFDVIKEGADPENKEERKGSYTVANTKIYKSQRQRVVKFSKDYVSPILKSHQIVMNPQPGVPISEDKIIVQSLDNYLLSRRMM